MSGVTDWIQPAFGVPGTVVVVLLVLAAAGLPLLPRSKNVLERLRRAREVNPNALTNHYVGAIITMWALGGVALLVPAVDPGVTLTDIGLGPVGDGFWYAGGYIVVVLLVAAPLRIIRQRRIPAGDRKPLVSRVNPMYPATARERWLAAAVAISAGVTEEFKYRGLFIAAGVGLLHLPVWAAVLVSSALFGFAHRYQGLRGMIGTGLLGLIFALLYLVSGNLLIPIVLHVLIDVLALVIAPAFSRGGRSEQSPRQSAAGPQPADRDPSRQPPAIRPPALRPPSPDLR
jgi:membrane protease YdiL (CAAX protease family)